MFVCANVRTVLCKEHRHTLRVSSVGFEHVSHRLELNRRTLVTEAEKQNWFVESVSCTADGFLLQVSHRQYGDPTTKKFYLKPKGGSAYALDEHA